MFELAVGYPRFGAEDGRRTVPEGAVLREVRDVALPPGRHTLEWTSLPETVALETLSLSLVSLSPGSTGARPGARIVGHRIEELPLGPSALALALYGAQARAIVLADPDRNSGYPAAPSRDRAYSGTIVSLSPEGLVMRVAGEYTTLPAAEVRAEKVLPRRRLLVDVEVTGEAAADLHLELTTGMDRLLRHAPRYTFRVDDAAGKGQLAGSIVLSNLTNQSLDGARIFLVEPLVTGPYTRRDPEVSGVAQTWGPGLGAAVARPFLIAAPLQMGSGQVARLSLVDARALPTTLVTQVRFDRLSELGETSSSPPSLVPVRTWSLDMSSLGLPVPLPPGEATIFWPTPEGPDAPAGQGYLSTGKSGVVQVTSRTPGYLTIEAVQESSRRAGRCVREAVWRYRVPSELFASGPLELVFPFEEKRVAVKLIGADGATLRVEPKVATTITIPPKSAARVLRVRLRVTECP